MKKRLTVLIALPILALGVYFAMPKQQDTEPAPVNEPEITAQTAPEAPETVVESETVKPPTVEKEAVTEPVLTPEQKESMRVAELKKAHTDRLEREALTLEQLIDKYGVANSKNIDYIKHSFNNRHQLYHQSNEEVFVGILSTNGHADASVKYWNNEQKKFFDELKEIQERYNN